MNKTIITGEFRLMPCYKVSFEHCEDCKWTRCIMQSDVCDETITFQTKCYPGHTGMSIVESLKIDMRGLIPTFDAMVAGKAPEKPFMVSTVISE